MAILAPSSAFMASSNIWCLAWKKNSWFGLFAWSESSNTPYLNPIHCAEWIRFPPHRGWLMTRSVFWLLFQLAAAVSLGISQGRRFRCAMQNLSLHKKEKGQRDFFMIEGFDLILSLGGFGEKFDAEQWIWFGVYSVWRLKVCRSFWKPIELWPSNISTKVSLSGR